MSRAVRLGSERERIIEDLDIKFSDFVREEFDKRFKNIEKLEEEIIQLQKKIDSRKDLIEEIKRESTDLTSEELKYIEDSKVVLERYGLDSTYFKNRFKGFLKQFRKKYLTIDKFIELVTK